MGKFFSALGISWPVFIAYLINFAVLIFILYKIGYKSIVEFVQNRTKEIETGIKNAEEAKKTLDEAKAEYEKLLAKARKESVGIIEQGQVKGKEQESAIVAKAKQEVAAVVAQGKQQIEAERTKMLEEVKSDVIEMVIASTKKVLSGAVNEDVDKAWLKDQLGKAKK